MYDCRIDYIVNKVGAYIQEGEYIKGKYSNELIIYDLRNIIRPIIEEIIKEIKEETKEPIAEAIDNL